MSACPELDIAGRGAPSAASELVGRIGQPVAGTIVGHDAFDRSSSRSTPRPPLSNEGFWVRCGPLRLWVQLVGQGESSSTVQAGKVAAFVPKLVGFQVTFNGTIVGHDASFPDRVGVTPAEGAGQLASDRIHAETAATALIVHP